MSDMSPGLRALEMRAQQSWIRERAHRELDGVVQDGQGRRWLRMARRGR